MIGRIRHWPAPTWWDLFGVCAIGVGVPVVRDLLVGTNPASRSVLTLDAYLLLLGTAALGVRRFRLTRQETGVTAPTSRSVLLGCGAGLALLLAAAIGNGYSMRPPSLWVTGWILLVVPIEELYFRGLLFAAIHRLAGVPAAVLGSSVAFALAHGLAYPGKPLLVVAIAGVYLGVLRVVTGNLWAPTIAHTWLDLVSASG